MSFASCNNHSCCAAGQRSFSCALFDNIGVDIVRVMSIFYVIYLIIGKIYTCNSKVCAT